MICDVTVGPSTGLDRADWGIPVHKRHGNKLTVSQLDSATGMQKHRLRTHFLIIQRRVGGREERGNVETGQVKNKPAGSRFRSLLRRRRWLVSVGLDSAPLKH